MLLITHTHTHTNLSKFCPNVFKFSILFFFFLNKTLNRTCISQKQEAAYTFVTQSRDVSPGMDVDTGTQQSGSGTQSGFGA